MAGQLSPNVHCLSPPSTTPEMNLDPAPVIPQPVYFAPRINLEAPRPRYAARNSGYALRSSPLAGPAMAVTRPFIIDDIYELEEKDNNIEADKTRRGATPSRISTLHPTPPPSLRNVSMSRTPSPSRSMSDISVKSSASSATSLSTAYSPPLSPATPPSLRPRPRSLVQPHSQSLPGAHTRTSITVPAPFEYTPSAASFGPNTSRDPTRNWLTTTAPPTFSRSRVKGVVMPMKASGKRPQTAPATPRAYSLDSEVVYVSPRRRHPHHKEPLSPDEARSQYRAMLWGHHPHGFDQPESYGVGTAIIRKQRRPRSLMALSLRSTLGEVREEHEREAEGESGGGGEGESGKDLTASGDKPRGEKLVFPVLTMKDKLASDDISLAARGRTENVTGWIKRRWKNSLKVVKGTFVKTGTASTLVAP